MSPEIVNSNSVKILDPLTGLLASKSSYRKDEIKLTFFEAFNFLQAKQSSFDKTKNTPNVIYELLKS